MPATADSTAGTDSVSAGDAAPVVVVGAGPAGLTAALQLTRQGEPVTVFESTDAIGGISRTEVRDGWRFDIGGHRFFTKVPEVETFWHEVLEDEEFLSRPRMSRILYRGKLFDYPLKPLNALKGLGIVEAVRCMASYGWVKVRPPKDQSNFETWVAARFGWRLYRIFFKTYTEKVWGMPATEIQADWAAQRIKNLTIMKAVIAAIRPQKGSTEITTLIDRFQYPKYGPGMMWERARDLVEKDGGRVVMETPVEQIHHEGGKVVGVTVRQNGQPTRVPASAVVSSMPLPDLVRAMEPAAPAEVLKAAKGLRHRDFLTVAIVLPQEAGFPDNWIYVHTPGVKVGRVQNYGSWSPYLVKDGRTCLGLEYFVNEGDEMWTMSDEDLLELAKHEITETGLARGDQVENGFVVRVPKAYPVYDAGYEARVDTIRAWIADNAKGLWPVGRNGMHKYNNQDHSMVTAMYAVDNILGGDRDLWAVNVEQEYHEQKDGPGTGTGTAGRPAGGTGREAPFHPLPASSADDDGTGVGIGTDAAPAGSQSGGVPREGAA